LVSHELLEVTIKTTHYFLKKNKKQKTIEWTQDTYGVLNVPQLSRTHFPSKTNLQSFAFAPQHRQ